MSKTITIPTWRNPYEVEINGVKYSYPAGSTQTVDNHVAAVIQQDIDAHADTAAPQMVQPRWGKYRKVEKRTWGCVQDCAESSGQLWFPMTEDMAAAVLASSDARCTVNGEEVSLDGARFGSYSAPSESGNGLYVPGVNAYGADGVTLTATIELEEIEKIPGDYLAGVVALVMEHDSDNNYQANMTPCEVAKLLHSGFPVICLNTFYSTSEQYVGFVRYDGLEAGTISCDGAGMPTVSETATDWNSY